MNAPTLSGFLRLRLAALLLLLGGFQHAAHAYLVYSNTANTYEVTITYGGGSLLTTTCGPGTTSISVSGVVSIRIYCQGQALNAPYLVAADGCTGRVYVSNGASDPTCAASCSGVQFGHCTSGASLPDGSNCVPPYGCDGGYCVIQ